jgi:hypothetical protein
MMGGETKKHMARLGTTYGVVNNFETDASPNGPWYKNLILINKVDLSAQWNLT